MDVDSQAVLIPGIVMPSVDSAYASLLIVYFELIRVININAKW